MDKQELRESIFYIIMSRKFSDSFGDEMGIDEEVAKQLADALIAEGLGFKDKRRVFVQNAPLLPCNDDDVYFVPNTPIKITQLYGDEEVEQIVKKRDEYKHRAEVAERALSKVFTKTFPWCCAKVREDIVNECLQEAEKELSEEGDNE